MILQRFAKYLEWLVLLLIGHLGAPSASAVAGASCDLLLQQVSGIFSGVLANGLFYFPDDFADFFAVAGSRSVPELFGGLALGEL